MFSRDTAWVWAAIVLLSGLFLTGQEPWPLPCLDFDRDGYGDPASPQCANPELDCDPLHARVHPAAAELCDGLDNQCPGDPGHGEVDEGCMLQLPEGCFDMGDAFAEGGADELPVHPVCVSAFEMDVHEVSNAEYAACVEAGGCLPPLKPSSTTRPEYFGNPAYDDFPVLWVEWFKARHYCNRLGKRLATEAEWEYAARGGLDGRRYPWGDSISGEDANFRDSGDPWDNDTCPVGQFAPNDYGLHDLAGNVWEWVNDWYRADYYAVSPQEDPPGPETGTEKVLRGGSWFYDPTAGFLRVSDRNRTGPFYEYRDVGFRCVR